MARTVWETIQVTGNQLAAAVQKLLDEGNVRRIRIRQGTRTIAEFPLTVGIVGAMFAPMLAAVGAVAALVTECTIEVERELDEPAPEPASEPGTNPGPGTEPGTRDAGPGTT
ncbi:MAG: DUF4342 domain-containing protein [Acidobacteriota bacterium]